MLLFLCFCYPYNFMKTFLLIFLMFINYVDDDEDDAHYYADVSMSKAHCFIIFF